MLIHNLRVRKSRLPTIFVTVLSITFVMMALLTTCSSNTQLESPNTVQSDCLDSVTIVAHRGGAALAPENTLKAFELGITLGADAVEMDVHMSKDGELIVIHDPTIDRTSDGTGSVRMLTLEQLQTFDVSTKYFTGTFGRQMIPTLEEVLSTIDGRVNVQLEIKVDADGSRYPGIEQLVLKTLEEFDILDTTMILSFDFPTIRAIEDMQPEVQTFALMGKNYMTAIGARGPDEIVRQVTASGADGVGISHAYLSPVLYEKLRSAGFRVGVWTVDTVALAKQFCELGVDFITTNRPDLF